MMDKHTIVSNNVQSFVSTSDWMYEKTMKINKRKVQFVNNVIVHMIPSRSEMSSEQRHKIWISKEEHKETKSQLHQLIRTMNQIEAQQSPTIDMKEQEQQQSLTVFPQGQSCNSIMYRGLEGKTNRSSTDKKLLTLDALCAVFLEQEQQRQQGIHCPEAISAVYSAVSSSATIDAIKLGLQDARWVNKELRSTSSSLSPAVPSSSSSKLTKFTRRNPSIDIVFQPLQQQQGQKPCRKSVVRRLLLGQRGKQENSATMIIT